MTTPDTVSSSSDKSAPSLTDMLKRLIKDVNKMKTTLKHLELDNEALRDQVMALRNHNAALAKSNFLLLMWENDSLAGLANSDDPETAAVSRVWMSRFSDLQGRVAPATFRKAYGVDAETGEEVGPGLLTDGDMSLDIFDIFLNDVPAMDMGRSQRDNGTQSSK